MNGISNGAATHGQQKTYKGREEECPRRVGDGRRRAGEHDRRHERAHEHRAGVPVYKGQRHLRVEHHGGQRRKRVDEGLDGDVQQRADARDHERGGDTEEGRWVVRVSK